MPRGPRLDAPGALHHVVARGIERGQIFFDDADREDFLDRPGTLVETRALIVYACALMPNHVHLLVRTATRPLQTSMRSLLSGYATRTNLRHARVGHLFQNRYRSTLCEDERYFFALVRYIHRNPIPAVVANLRELATYPYAGHSALLGRCRRSWYPRDEILLRFGTNHRAAMTRYAELLAEDANEDLEGGGLGRSRNGLRHLPRLAWGREHYRSDERILGSSEFVERVLREQRAERRRDLDLRTLVDEVSHDLDLDPGFVRGQGRSRAVARARSAIACLWTARLGGSVLSLARHLGLSISPVRRAAARGTLEAPRWDSLLERIESTHRVE